MGFRGMVAELKKAFCNKIFYAVILVGCFAAAMAFFNSTAWGLSKFWMRYMAGDEDAIASALKFNYTDMPLEVWMPRYGTSNRYYYLWITILPILCVLPYGLSYYNEKRKGMINQLVYRMGRKQYFMTKLFVAFINGGCVAVIPMIVNLLLCMCFIPWGTPLLSTKLYPVVESNVFCNIFYTRPFLYVCIYLILMFILFGLLNCLALFFVYFIDNAFALMITPFVLYFAEHVLLCLGLGRGELSLLNNSNLYNVFSVNMWMYVVELSVLLVIDLLFLIRIKKDVL